MKKISLMAIFLLIVIAGIISAQGRVYYPSAGSSLQSVVTGGTGTTCAGCAVGDVVVVTSLTPTSFGVISKPSGSNYILGINDSGLLGFYQSLNVMLSTSNTTTGLSGILQSQGTGSNLSTVTIGAGLNLDNGTLSATSEPELISPADHSISGTSMSFLSTGATVTIMNLLNLNSSGEWVLSNATTTAASTSLLAVALETKATGTINVGLPGSIMRDDSWSWTPGALLFVGTSGGAITATAPSGTGQVIRVVGYALSTTKIYFYPEPGYMTHN